MPASDLATLEEDLPTTPADIEALRRARDGSRMTPADVAAVAEQLGPPSADELRARPGPQGEPFELPPESAT